MNQKNLFSKSGLERLITQGVDPILKLSAILGFTAGKFGFRTPIAAMVLFVQKSFLLHCHFKRNVNKQRILLSNFSTALKIGYCLTPELFFSPKPLFDLLENLTNDDVPLMRTARIKKTIKMSKSEILNFSREVLIDELF